jgi:hypothetical protein
VSRKCENVVPPLAGGACVKTLKNAENGNFRGIKMHYPVAKNAIPGIYEPKRFRLFVAKEF